MKLSNSFTYHTTEFCSGLLFTNVRVWTEVRFIAFRRNPRLRLTVQLSTLVLPIRSTLTNRVLYDMCQPLCCHRTCAKLRPSEKHEARFDAVRAQVVVATMQIAVIAVLCQFVFENVFPIMHLCVGVSEL
jgi:hypothetical protein